MVFNNAMNVLFGNLLHGTKKTVQIGDYTLTETEILVTPEMLTGLKLPDNLRLSFKFDPRWIKAGKPMYSKSVVIAAFPMRLDANGHVAPCSLSIKMANHNSTQNALPLGEVGTPTRVLPDLFVEAPLYDVNGHPFAFPELAQKPFAKKGETRLPVSIALSSAAEGEPGAENAWFQARCDFEQRAAAMAERLGVRVGEQFICCLVGFATYSKGMKETPKKGAWYAVALDSYILGGSKLGTQDVLPEKLSGLKVDANMRVTSTGKTLNEVAMQEIAALMAGAPAPVVEPTYVPAPVPAPAPAPAPAPLPVVAPQAVQAPVVSAPAPAPAPAPVAVASAPATSDFSAASLMAAFETEDDFSLVEVPQAGTVSLPLPKLPEEEAFVFDSDDSWVMPEEEAFVFDSGAGWEDVASSDDYDSYEEPIVFDTSNVIVPKAKSSLFDQLKGLTDNQ